MTTVEEQIRIFSVFFIIGLFIGIIFDFFRCFRKVVKTSNIIVYLLVYRLHEISFLCIKVRLRFTAKRMREQLLL